LDYALRKFAAVGRWAHREFVAAWPVFLFFSIGFLLLLTIVKLVLANFSIEMTALSKAIIGALFAAKAVLILDGTPLERHLERYRRIVAVTVKTLIYGFITLLLGFLERLLEALHREHGIAAATRFVIEQASMNRLLAWALGITLVFGLYFALFEISKRMGEGKLWELFFGDPKFSEPSGASSQRSNASGGNVRG
jgi:hypothetical protein